MENNTEAWKYHSIQKQSPGNWRDRQERESSGDVRDPEDSGGKVSS